MATARLVPSTYSLSSESYLTASDTDNMYTNVDSTTSGTFTHTRATTNSTYYAYLRGFNFGDIPSRAVVSAFTVKIKASATGHTTSTSNSYKMSLYNGTTSLSSTYASSTLSTTTNTISFSNGSYTWANISGYGADFGIRIPLRRANSNTADVVTVYGAEIEVTYTVPEARTITTTLTGDGTISPSGQTTVYDGDTFTLTITPTDTSAEVTATKDGTDITDQLVAHGGGGEETLANTATSYTTGGTISSGSQYLAYPVGYTAENPRTYSSNIYSSSGNTGYAIYSFDFSGIPEGATIESVTVKCSGLRENATDDNTHKADLELYTDTTLKVSSKFTSTSQQVVTIDGGTWTRAELLNAKLRFTVAYYGGRLYGITWTVVYSTPISDPDYYTYSYTVNGNATIAVTIGGGGGGGSGQLYVKRNGSWHTIGSVYVKQSGSWVLQTDLSGVFDTSAVYVKGD